MPRTADDILLFNQGVTAEQLWLQRINNSLVISIVSATQQVVTNDNGTTTNYDLNQKQRSSQHQRLVQQR
jgi:hypothetical protein